MSTICSYTTRCILCGNESKHERISSYSLFGYPDLDFRPQAMYRETMDYWVQECPNCGYVNTQLDKPCDLPKEKILNIYNKIESAFDWKKSYAVRFAKLGAMLVNSGDSFGAAEQFLRVAWVFDDDKNENEATFWRKMAIEYTGLPIALLLQNNLPEEMVCVYMDILRRTGNFKGVLKMDEMKLHTDLYINLIKYQKELSEQGDSTAHTLGDNEDVRVFAEKYNGGMFFMM